MNVMESLGGYLKKTYDVMADMGLLLGSVGGDGRVNLMTIGWGLIGIVWFKPIFLVAVRKTRYTHKLMEETGVFTVNVPSWLSSTRKKSMAATCVKSPIRIGSRPPLIEIIIS